MAKTTGAIEFFDFKLKRKVWVSREDCRVEDFVTSKGKRRRLIATVRDNPNDPAECRELSKLCSANFEL